MCKTAIWILEKRDDLPDGDDPWEPWYDRCFGLVIEASDESSARAIAHESCVTDYQTILRDRQVFLDPMYTKCLKLEPTGHERTILADFRSS
jgi:hypothetical protein